MFVYLLRLKAACNESKIALCVDLVKFTDQQRTTLLQARSTVSPHILNYNQFSTSHLKHIKDFLATEISDMDIQNAAKEKKRHFEQSLWWKRHNEDAIVEQIKDHHESYAPKVKKMKKSVNNENKPQEGTSSILSKP